MSSSAETATGQVSSILGLAVVAAGEIVPVNWLLMVQVDEARRNEVLQTSSMFGPSFSNRL
jgi:hypothetical protein